MFKVCNLRIVGYCGLYLFLLGNPCAPHGHPVGDLGHVGNHGDGVHPFAAQLCRVLVGLVHSGRGGVQRPGNLVRTQDLQAARNARIQMGEHSVGNLFLVELEFYETPQIT